MIHRKTKIVCTLGPATEDDAVLRELILSGMNVARLNFSHGTHETHLNNIRRIEAFRRELNLPIAIMLDTKGPEIRLETFENGKVQLKKGQTFTLVTQSVVGNAERALHHLSRPSARYPGGNHHPYRRRPGGDDGAKPDRRRNRLHRQQ